MPFTLTMPKLSPTMEGGTIVKWHKKEGDTVKGDDLLFEVTTDKATVEYHALDGGFLRKILIHENEEALVNQALAIFTEEKDESIEGYEPEKIREEKKETESFKEEVISEGEPLINESVSSAKEKGIVQPIFPVEPPLESYSFEFETSMKSHRLVSPLAKKLARDKRLDLTTVKGSGPNGRVMSRDLDLAKSDAAPPLYTHQTPTQIPGSYDEETMSPMRKVIGQKLQASKTFIPHFYVQQDIDVLPMIESREQLKVNGVKVTFNDFVMRATALALREHPVVNSGFDNVKNVIVRFKTIDIALAVSIEGGLMTPILRHVDYKTLREISVEVKHLVSVAKEGKLKAHEYRGGSFTVSNLGMFGIHDFQAVINPPQVSILAIGGVRECPVIKNGQIVPGKRMMVSLSSDHRVVDGADAAKFLKTFQKLLENPAILLI